MKTIRFNCPKCDQSIEAPGEIASQSLNCPTCGHEFTAPLKKPRWLWYFSLSSCACVLIGLAVLNHHRSRSESTSSKQTGERIEGLFGLRLHELLPPECVVLATNGPLLPLATNGPLLLSIVPPQTNSMFKEYTACLDPDGRLVGITGFTYDGSDDENVNHGINDTKICRLTAHLMGVSWNDHGFRARLQAFRDAIGEGSQLSRDLEARYGPAVEHTSDELFFQYRWAHEGRSSTLTEEEANARCFSVICSDDAVERQLTPQLVYSAAAKAPTPTPENDALRRALKDADEEMRICAALMLIRDSIIDECLVNDNYSFTPATIIICQ